MRTRSVVTTAAFSLFGLTLAACMVPEAPDPVDGPSQSPSASLSTEPEPDPSSTGSLEGAFTYETMDDYVEIVQDTFLYPWLEETWPSMQLPTVLYVPDGVTGPEGCTDYSGAAASYSTESYEYCAPDATVYVGQSLLWEFYEETGDAGPAMGMAHEFGHHIQAELGVDPPYTPQQSIVFENQADCIAGAWAQWMDAKGYLETEDDLADIDLLMPMIASAESEGDDRDHGTLEERIESFYDGFNGGVTACGLSAG